MSDRPNSGLRGGGRAATRRGKDAAAPAATDDADAANGAEDEGEPATWKVELESIMAGTHPTLIEALVPHDAKMKQIIAQADRVRQLQMINVNALFDCEKKQADDENKVRVARAPAAWHCFIRPMAASACRTNKIINRAKFVGARALLFCLLWPSTPLGASHSLSRAVSLSRRRSSSSSRRA